MARDDGLNAFRGILLAVVLGAVFWALVIGLAALARAQATGVRAGSATTAAVVIPERCRTYLRTLTAAAHDRFGLNAPVATLAAQIHQESGCRPDARSGVGAQGLTQFMPATADWLAQLYPRELGAADPMNWRWAIQAQVLYMAWLTQRNPGKTECDTWAFGFASYNGGEGWLRRDQAVCDRTGPSPDRCGPCDPAQWFSHVELTPDKRRAPANIRENRGYPQRILFVLAPAYDAAGWGRAVQCPAD